MEDFLNRVPGQDKALLNLYKIYKSQRLPNAFLFSGKKGVGKHLAAIEFVKLINDQFSDKSSASVINGINSLSEPYIRYIFPMPRGKNESGKDKPYDKLSPSQLEDIRDELDKKKANPYYELKIDKAPNIKISSIRDIKKFSSLSYTDYMWRVIIISEAERMSVESQNALLKSLEEPSDRIIYILLSSDSSKLLPTIKSRCWNIEFSPLQRPIISNILVKKFLIDEQDALKVSYFSNGSVTDAVNLLQFDLDEILNSTITILRYSFGRRYFTAYNEFENYIKNYSPEIILLILQFILMWLDDVIKDRYSIENFYFEAFRETITKFNEKFDKIEIIELSNKINMLRSSVDKKVSLNLIALNAIFELGSLVSR